MKKITDAEWTRSGNVIISLNEIVSYTESFGKQVPVTSRQSENITVEISDKEIERNSDVEKANEVVFAELKSKGVDVYNQKFDII